MLRQGNERDKLGGCLYHLVSPTSGSDLAKTCVDILSYNTQSKINSKGDIYYFSNKSVASWYVFKVTIIDLVKVVCYIKSIETKDYPTAVK